MLNEKHEIEDYEMKASFLKRNGWTDLWHVDNWVDVSWFRHPTINVDKAGVSINSAYKFVKKQYDESHQTKLF